MHKSASLLQRFVDWTGILIRLAHLQQTELLHFAVNTIHHLVAFPMLHTCWKILLSFESIGLAELIVR